jgi:hypothetical protein
MKILFIRQVRLPLADFEQGQRFVQESATLISSGSLSEWYIRLFERFSPFGSSVYGIVTPCHPRGSDSAFHILKVPT